MKNTKIEWADHTINFWIGCAKVSDGCKHCYMYREQKRYGGDPNAVRRTSEAYWRQARRLNANAREKGVQDTVFANSWSDFFLEAADPWRDDAWRLIRENTWLIFLILTKRTHLVADRLPDDWEAGYDNVWLGASIESQEYIHRLNELAKVPAAHRFISYEPGLAWTRFIDSLVPEYRSHWAQGYQPNEKDIQAVNAVARAALKAHGIGLYDWLILGGESGGKEARPFDLEWVRRNVAEAKAAGIPVFTKQLGSHWARANGAKDSKGADPAEWPEPFPRETPWD